MKTSFDRLTHLVLFNEDINKVAAIIECEAGEDIDISERVKQAIKDDEMLMDVELSEVENDGTDISFTALTIDEDEVHGETSYTLYDTMLYK